MVRAMIFGSLTFAAREWLVPAAIGMALALLLIIYTYAKAPSLPGTRWACASLRALAVALLFLCLLEPMWTTSRPREGANYFAVVADNSMGLQIHDRGDPKSRSEHLRELLTSNQESWQAALEQTFLVRRYLFDSHLASSRDFSELDFRGRSSALVSALRRLSERFQGQPLAGILLYTDGNATDLGEGPLELPSLPPIYPVVLGQPGDLDDVAIQKVSVNQTAFEDAPVTVLANVSAAGFRDRTVAARLYSGNKLVAEQSQRLEKNAEEVSFRFQVKPEKPGVSFYELKASVEGAAAEAEATQHNNLRTLAVDRGQGPYRILYVAGRPNWEYKFLNRALSEDPELNLVGLMRIARREPKFTFRGRAGESSNPLFRGFAGGGEETERYDQPVLIRLNTRDESELRGGFPKIPEDLYGYHAVILDDLEAEFFTADQMNLLQKFVSERGGGFLMLGGADSLQDGKYARTPVGDMLPIYLDRLPAQVTPGTGRFDFTREGWLQPWVRLRQTEQEEKSRLEAIPGYKVFNQLHEAKPGASVLATITDPNAGTLPAIAIQRFGAGRSACITIGDLWRGALGDEHRQTDLAKWWRQIARWLTADVPPRFELRAETEADESVRLRVTARDEKFEPLENAQIRIKVRAAGPGAATNEVTLTAEPSEREAGVYLAKYVPRDTGAYLAQANIADEKGLSLAEVEAGWASEPLGKEFERLSPNVAVLEEIARKTGGEIVQADRLESFVDSLSQRKAPIEETFSTPLWHRGGYFALVIAALALEWGLRRWRGLA